MPSDIKVSKVLIIWLCQNQVQFIYVKIQTTANESKLQADFNIKEKCNCTTVVKYLNCSRSFNCLFTVNFPWLWNISLKKSLIFLWCFVEYSFMFMLNAHVASRIIFCLLLIVIDVVVTMPSLRKVLFTR